MIRAWTAQAACLDQWALFDSEDATDQLSARRICRRCPVRTPCGLYADALLHARESEMTSLPGTWSGIGTPKLFNDPFSLLRGGA